MTPKRKSLTEACWESRLLGLVTVALVVFGVAAVYSSSSIHAVQQGLHGSFYALRQFGGALVGTAMLLVATRIDYNIWKQLAWPILAIAFVGLLVLLLPFTQGGIAEAVNNSRRWLNLGFGKIQPSEAAKFALVVWTAMIAAKKGTRIREFKVGIVPVLVVTVPMCLMVAIEPDLSTAMLTMLVCMFVLFSAGAKIGHFLLLGVLAVPLLWTQISTLQYRINRMVAFLSPGEDPQGITWQINQSIVGFGSGGIFGVGFGEGTQKLGHLTYGYSDFIFSTIGEEWGLFGVTVIIALYAVYLSLGMRIARRAGDSFGTLLAVGLTSLVGITAVLHMYVTLALAPTTGLPLPFISVGRSNLLMLMFATGIIMNIGNQGAVRPAR